MTIGRVVGKGGLAAVGLAIAVLGLTWLNRVSSAVMNLGGSCGSGGPYEIATPCPTGAWMAPVGIFVGLFGLAVHAFTRPPGSPALWVFAWPALFGSLGVQFLRAAAAESDAWGFWLCGVLFLLMAVAPLLMIFASDRRALVRTLLGDGLAGPEPAGAAAPDRRDLTVPNTAPGVDVTFVRPASKASSSAADRDDDEPDLALSLDRLARLHRTGELSDAEFADAKQKVLDGA
jgi:hypothetical protein